MKKSRNIWNIGINQIAKWAREGVQSIINALQDPNLDYGYVYHRIYASHYCRIFGVYLNVFISCSQLISRGSFSYKQKFLVDREPLLRIKGVLVVVIFLRRSFFLLEAISLKANWSNYQERPSILADLDRNDNRKEIPQDLFEGLLLQRCWYDRACKATNSQGQAVNKCFPVKTHWNVNASRWQSEHRLCSQKMADWRNKTVGRSAENGAGALFERGAEVKTKIVVYNCPIEWWQAQYSRRIELPVLGKLESGKKWDRCNVIFLDTDSNSNDVDLWRFIGHGQYYMLVFFMLTSEFCIDLFAVQCSIAIDKGSSSNRFDNRVEVRTCAWLCRWSLNHSGPFNYCYVGYGVY